jgi:VWFA-related protein
MRRWLLLLVLLAAGTGQCLGAAKLLVTVIESRTGRPVADLSTADFAVTDSGRPRPIESCEYTSTPVDVMMLVDSSLVGEMVLPVAADLVGQLREKEQMAIVAFHSAADLVQDFTSSKEHLLRAVREIKFGNNPRVLDAVFAAADGGFANTSFRRVILLVTTGVEGPSRVTERSVIKVARRNGISIYPVYAVGYARGMFERLAVQTGGASFNLRDLTKEREDKPPAARIFEVLRNHYTLTLRGNLALGENVKVEVKRPGRYLVSALPLD